MKQFRLYDSEDHVTEEGARVGTRVVPAGSLLVLVRGMTLHNDLPICMTMREMTFNQDLKALVPKKQVDAAYLAYWMLANKPSLMALVDSASHGTGRIHTDVIKAVEVDLPSLPEQRAIASILGALDDKIELNRRMNETLEQITQAIFKSWFVDFDPVRAKNSGATGFAGVPKAVFDGLPVGFVESALGLVPAGWSTLPFRDFVTESKAVVGTNDVPMYSSTNDGLKPRSETFTKELSRAQDKNRLIRRHDLVFGLSRQILNFGLMRDPIGAVSPVYKVFAVNEGIVVPDFVECYMRSRMPFYSQLIGSSSREGQSIVVEQFLDTCLLVPPRPVQEAFYCCTRPLEDARTHNEAESRTLAAIRDALLPRLLSGEIRVKDAEKMVEGVA